jgi:hypothetical protein
MLIKDKKRKKGIHEVRKTRIFAIKILKLLTI